MKKIFWLICLALPLFILSCSEGEVSNPVRSEGKSAKQNGNYFSGIEVYFDDNCSYSFAVSFLSELGSAVVVSTSQGNNFQNNMLTINVPEKTAFEWQKSLSRYPFITEVYPVVVCYN